MIGAFVEGLRRVARAPWLLLGLWAWTLAAAISWHWSPPATRLAVRVYPDWFSAEWVNLLNLPGGWSQPFVWQMGSIFVLGASAESAARLLAHPPVQIAVAHAALALFLDGGVLDRLARDRRVGAAGFFAACGGCFGRLARVGIIAVPLYWLLFAYASPAAAIAAAVLLHPIFGYAKVRAVVEDRRSALGALAAGFRFVRRHPLDVLGLYFLNILLFWLALRLQDSVGAFALQAGPLPASAVVLPALVAAAISLQAAASSIALFQSRLAHAGYTAAPPPAWPESPAAEAIRLMD